MIREKDQFSQLDEQKIEEMVTWFFDNYENPAESVPVDSGEYQYYNGGPYDPLEEIGEEFIDADSMLVKAASKRIYLEGWDWVKKDEY